VATGERHRLIYQGFLPCSTQAPAAQAGRFGGGPPALRIRAGRSNLSRLLRPNGSTGRHGNTLADATLY
jgi:hypothetical protein